MSLDGELLENSIAIIGMGCYLPDAACPEEFWGNLVRGHESVREDTDGELLSAGVGRDELLNPDYVRCGVPLAGFDEFDPAFFGLNPRESEVMDPQHRKFLECAWHTHVRTCWAHSGFV